MRRLLTSSALLGLFLPALLVLPASPARPPAPRPVAPSVHALDVPSSGELPQRAVSRFDTVGVTWSGPASATVQVRTRTAAGWSPWQELAASDSGPDRGSREDRTDGLRTSSPVWVGHADGVQLRSTDPQVRHLRLLMVDGGSSPADADPAGTATGPGTAAAAAAQPTVYTRAQWGADESLRSYNGTGCLTPDYSSTIKVGFVHHTDSANGYASGDVPAIIRSIYAYHVKTNGWCDIGYNFLVDRFGRVWEGRYGGIDRAVIGAHTGGFNTNSFGSALIGTYTTTTPSSAMLGAVKKLYAWKLAHWYRDPLGTATLTSAGGGTSKYAAGTVVTFNTISGHRDAGSTACPGDAAYSQLGGIRTGTDAVMGSGFVTPSVTDVTGGQRVRAGVLGATSWRLDVRSQASGAVVRSYTGSTSTGVDVTWDRRDATGAFVDSGTPYALRLTGTSGTATALPWSAVVGANFPGALAAAPVASNQLALAGRSSAGTVALRQLVDSSTSAATSLGGAAVGAPALATRTGGAQTLVVRGTDDALWSRERPAGGSWSSWTSLGGQVSAPPALAAGAGGRLELLVRGTDGALYRRSSTAPGSWGGWQKLGGAVLDGTGPAGAWTATGRLDVLVVGSDSAVWRRSWTSTGGWTGWRSSGGRTTTSPTAYGPAGDETLVAVTGTDGKPYAGSVTTSGSTPWRGLGGATPFRPTVTAGMTVTTTATTSTTSPSPSPSPSPTATSGSTVSSDATALVVGTNGLLYRNLRVAGSWKGWERVG